MLAEFRVWPSFRNILPMRVQCLLFVPVAFAKVRLRPSKTQKCQRSNLSKLDFLSVPFSFFIFWWQKGTHNWCAVQRRNLRRPTAFWQTARSARASGRLKEQKFRQQIEKMNENEKQQKLLSYNFRDFELKKRRISIANITNCGLLEVSPEVYILSTCTPPAQVGWDSIEDWALCLSRSRRWNL